MFHYGYYVLFHDGRLVLSGNDWGRTPDTYKAGSKLGVRNGVEGTVVAVVKGDPVKRFNVDVMVIVDQQPVSGPRNPVPRQVVDSMVAALHEAPHWGPPTIQTLWKERDVRAVGLWNKVILRPPTETFHEFLVAVPLKWNLGEDWYKNEMAKQANRHILIRWLEAFREQQRNSCPPNHQKGRVYAAPATGEITELIALAHDLYLLQKVNRLPDSLITRLRNYDQFQGVRYEIAIAGAFVKCGFEIEWVEEKSAKHPEFIARNASTGEEVAVETKSRRRGGVLHHPGALPPAEQLRADVDRLYRDALQQDSGTCPFAIFLDVNLPPDTAEAAPQWQREIMGRWQPNEQLALLGFTNFAWHYSGAGVPRPPEFLLSVPIKSNRPLVNADTLGRLQLVLDTYGVCANEY